MLLTPGAAAAASSSIPFGWSIVFDTTTCRTCRRPTRGFRSSSRSDSESMKQSMSDLVFISRHQHHRRRRGSTANATATATAPAPANHRRAGRGRGTRRRQVLLGTTHIFFFSLLVWTGTIVVVSQTVCYSLLNMRRRRILIILANKTK